jgi:hypothetical protein
LLAELCAVAADDDGADEAGALDGGGVADCLSPPNNFLM